MTATPSSPAPGGLPPYDEVAERSVLSSMMGNEYAVSVGVEMLVAEDFYLPRHRVLFGLFRELHVQQRDLDVVFVRAEVERRGLWERVGGAEYLDELLDAAPTPANINRYCAIVRERAVERSLLDVSAQIAQMTRQPEPGCDAAALLQRAEEMIYAVADRRATGEPVSIESVLGDVLQEAERYAEARAQNRPIPSRTISTGYSKLDGLFAGGLWPGEVMVVAGRPGSGKTTFALNIARQVAVKDQAKGETPVPVAIFSLEMTKEQLTKNLLSSEAQVDSTQMRTYDFGPQEYDMVKTAAEQLKQAPIFIDETPGLSPMTLRNKARRLRHREKIGLVVIDYLQLMQVSRRYDGREQEVAEMSRQVKHMARELDIPVILLSQLRRPPTERENQAPVISDLRESGSIEQDADVIVMLHHEADRTTGVRLNKGTTVLLVQKNRNGPVGTVILAYRPSCFRFDNYQAETRETMAVKGG